MATRPEALLFDVFGTVVDWRGSIAREVGRVGRKHGVRADWSAFADAWRSGYRPAMDRVRRGVSPWRSIDELHLEIVMPLLRRAGLRLSRVEARELNLAWHRLKPWPDSAAGLARLKRHFRIGTLSNGNMSLLVDLARAGRLPFDASSWRPSFFASTNRIRKSTSAPRRCWACLPARSCWSPRTRTISRPRGAAVCRPRLCAGRWSTDEGRRAI
jgi:2-haloalkanoic acid dehalogenase type II